MDTSLRALWRKFSTEPTVQNLVSMLTAITRSGDYEKRYPELIKLLRKKGPFDEKQWPWYKKISDKKSKIDKQLHLDILSLILRIRPVTAIVDFALHPDYLIHALTLVRKELLQVPEDEELAQHPEFWEMGDYPLFITVEIRRFNNEIPTYPDEVIVTIVNAPGPFPTRDAVRYGVNLNGEPPGIIWICKWMNLSGRWMVVDSDGWSAGQKESETFLPYKEYCDGHNQNREKCVPCEICKDGRGHPCQCKQCFYCEKWVNTWDADLIPEGIRCNCDS